MSNVEAGTEVLRKTLEQFTGLKFVYASQAGFLSYPIGIVQRITEVPQGIPIRAYIDGKEIVRSYVQVPVQIDFITQFSKSNPKHSMFYSREVLEKVQAGCYSSEWTSLFDRNKVDNPKALAAILSVGGISGAHKIDGNETLWYSRMEITLSVANEYSREDFPCLDEENLFDQEGNIDIKFDIRK